MSLADLSQWLDQHAQPRCIWYIKRLSANDTLATNAHQAGPYIPREFLFDIFPALNRPDVDNPDVWFDLYVDSHADHRKIRGIWYNNRLRGGTRNETRLTNLGGRESALLDPDSTGSLVVFAFLVPATGDAAECRVWVCRGAVEEDLIEDRIGPVEPGKWRVWSPGDGVHANLFERAIPPARTGCRLSPQEIPAAWLERFPSGMEIIAKTIEFRPVHGMAADTRLLRRRECEYEIFQSVEQAIEMPAIQRGFGAIEEFLAHAQTILQRRKARSGRSLELHTRTIFLEDGLVENTNFSYQPESEQGKSPDFLFPSVASYRDPHFPADSLRMLAVKTTCKDRWRQILNEANRVQTKHLLTLQEGVSENQFREMEEAGVQLVVPSDLHASYPAEIRPRLQTLGNFINSIRLLPVL